MGLFPQQFIDDLRQQVNIVSVIQDYVPLKHVGNNHKGLCPFHSEKTPSFTVHAEKGFFHCFGCNAGGAVAKLATSGCCWRKPASARLSCPVP